jgi:murein DD-endopeptidase MepM/ murein hydrolase activator NlpD
MTVSRPVVACTLAAALLAARPAAAHAAGSWVWPVGGPVISGFDPPASPYGSGHRGIDIATPVGTEVVAPAAGVVAFAGPVGGRLFLTIDHGGGVESTYSWLSSLVVRRGDEVAAGQPIARSGEGHPGDPIAHLHVGVRLDDVYVDPLDYLASIDMSSLIRLAPLVA